ncbi:cobalt-zinc-cadmium efflux system protein [Modicisalibacter ilicicola DSM 19980]|uniref:Cobalt-zinc-cadmium efflux system protein n=1 Tax=Modicisalibacter ilicicola DSM 19980 TaxID=1121942 RepID=A0A1M5DNU6_9GAMM|nr:cation diffusion facilitator family transporter [Halomonas ilicicola]SHF68679.1 cobalt-zinc-cadmium efflux system protein [Halomonas ilicicola DSM 19980]
MAQHASSQENGSRVASHDPDHAHAHEHAPAVTADSEKRVFWAMLLTAGFMLAEIVGGIVSGSLALLADAGHMFSDSASLAMALAAFRLSARSPDPRRTFGYRRFQVLAAFVNGLTLFAIALWIFYSAIERLMSPVEVMAGPMMIIAIIGLFVNIVAFVILHRGDSGNLNLRGAAMHVLGDLLGSVAAIAAALIIMFTGWNAADPILSVLAAGLILRAAWQILRRSSHTLLEGTPDGVEVAEIRTALESIEEVESLHDVHLWGLTPQDPLLSLHLVVRDGADHAGVLRQAYKLLRERFGITHATLQLEGEACLTGGDCETSVSSAPENRESV